MDVKGVARNLYIEQRCVGWKRPWMLIFVAMRGDQISAIYGTIDRDFAFFATANGADLFAFCWTKSLRFSFFADWAGHSFVFQCDEQNTLCDVKIKNGVDESRAIYGPTSSSEVGTNGFERTYSGRKPMPMTRAGNWRSHG